MAQLTEYKRKRNFRVTSEPPARVAGKKGHSFIIQKHAARRLHYDFRLELDGVLKSWAVPKGPCLDPGVKRLAVEVEDHPLSYGSFEGTIPHGEYGGGSVIVWDRGTWEPEGDPHAGLRQGRLHFSLHGEKLSGRWNLIRGRSAAAGKPQWLLIKSRDEAAQPAAACDVEAARPESVLTGVRIEQVAARVDAKGRLRPRRAGGRATLRKPRQPRSRGTAEVVAQARRTDAPPVPQDPAEPSPLPDFIAPQLAVLVSAPPPGERYFHEVKLDGYRVLARGVYSRGTPEVVLRTRTGKDWTDKFAAIAEAVACLDVDSVYLDGEVVALDEEGRSDFQRLQNSLNGRSDAVLYYCVFDLLYLNGYDLRPRPLWERKELLEALLSHNPHPLLRYSKHSTGSGLALWRRCCRQRLEGLVCKDRRAPYVSSRTADWVKVKCKNRQEFIIVGYTDPKGTRAHLGALLLAAHAPGGALRYAGRVGTGLRIKTLRELKEQLSALKTAKPPVAEVPPSREITWVKPHLVAEVEFSEFTAENLLRHASFLGLRADKPAAEVVLEVPASAPSPRRAPSAKSEAPAAFPLTHPDKILFAPDGPTKSELADYYARVTERMWPYVQGHPLALLRCPDGIKGPCFFHKHLVSASAEPGLATIDISEKHGPRHYRYLDAPVGLRSLVQLGVLELHLWGSLADDVEHPIELVFDLDPAPEVPWVRTVEGARRVRRLLQRLGLRCFVKLSGGKGMHLHVPIAPRYDFSLAKRFCHAVARQLAEEQPSLFTVALAKRERAGKIFLDYLRNGRGATYIAPFSARARAGAPIAVPIPWTALDKDLSPSAYTVRTLATYLRRYPRDPWAGYAGLRQPIAMLAES